MTDTDYDPATGRSDTDLPDQVERIVREVAFDLLDKAMDNSQESGMNIRYDGGDLPNEITTEAMEERMMDASHRVIDAGPLPRADMVQMYSEDRYDTETMTRYFAAVNLQHMVLDRLDAVCRRGDDQ